MATRPVVAPADQVGAKQWLLVALVSMAGLGAFLVVAFWVVSGSLSAQESTAATTFTPTVTITVPQTDADGDGANDFSGTTFRVTFSRASGSNDGCTARASRSYSVNSAGVVSGSAPSLVDSPAGVISRCSYGVVFSDFTLPSFSGTGRGALYLESGASTSVTASSSSISGSYSATSPVSGTSFDPDVTVSVPWVDEGDDEVHDFSGAGLWIQYSTRTRGCASRVFEKLMIEDGGSTAVDGTAVRLAEYPAGATTGLGCNYVVEPYLSSRSDLSKPPGLGQSVAVTATGEASISFATIFIPSISITVPQTDADNNRVNDFSGIYFKVRFYPVGGFSSGCTRSSYETHGVKSSGKVGVVARGNVLVDRLASSTSRCSYRLEFPGSGLPSTFDSDVIPLYLQSGASSTISAASNSGSASYLTTYTPSGSSFRPKPRFSIPDLDENDDGINDYSGTIFLIEYIDNHDHSCPESVFEKYIVADDGTLSVHGSFVRLDEYIDGGPTLGGSTSSYLRSFCRYHVLIKKIFGTGGLDIRSYSQRIISRITNGFTISLVTEFSSSISITVPQTDADGDGVNDYSGLNFELEYTPTTGINDRSCSLLSAIEYYTVGDDGIVVLDRSEVTTSDWLSFRTLTTRRSLKLVDRPAGTDARCSYNVSFPNSFRVFDRLEGLHMQAGSVTTVSGTSRVASVTYGNFTPSAQNFSATLTITVPQFDDDGDGTKDFAGTIIGINYVGSSREPGCPENIFERYTVGASGLVALSGPRAKLNQYPLNSDSGAYCEYSIVPIVSSNLRELSSSRVSSQNPTATISFGTYFTPSVSISISDLDTYRSLVLNDYSLYYDFRFRVDFSPVVGSADYCVGRYFVIYELIDGRTELDSFNLEYTPTLVDRSGSGISSCTYDVEFYIMYHKKLYLQPGATSTVSATSSAATAEYSTTYRTFGDVFSPSLTINAPSVDADGDGANDFIGAKFKILYDFYHVFIYCPSAVEETYVIGDDGTPRLEGASASLQANFLGEQVNYRGSNGQCEYELSLEVLSGFGDETILIHPSNTSLKVSSASPSQSFSLVSTFSPDVTISAPYFDDDADGDRDIVSESFMLTYVPVAGSNPGCFSSIVEQYYIRSRGDVQLSWYTEAVLVDRLPGLTTRCEYDISWSEPAGFVLQSGTATVQGSSPTASGTYVDGFHPSVAISVPQVDATSGVANDFSNTRFTISYTKTTGPATGCSVATSETYIVNDNGIVALSGVAASLVNRPSRSSIGTSCSYSVSIGNTNSNLQLQSGASTSVNQDSQSVSANFNSIFSATVAAYVPQINADGSDNNIYSGTNISVSIGKTDNTGCSPQINETHTVATGGAVDRPNDPIVLLDRVAGSSAKCVYPVTFEPLIANKALGNRFVRDEVALTYINRTAEARYQRMSYFYPNMTFEVYEHDVNEDGVHDLSGTEIKVDLRRASSSSLNPFCSANTFETYVIQGSGGASTAGSSVDLAVGQPGATENCVYTVSYEIKYAAGHNFASGRLVVQSSSVGSVSSGAAEVTVVLAAGFVPVVDILVPDFSVANVNQFSGTVVGVTFSRADGASLLCSDSVSATYTVGDSGTALLDGSVVLVDSTWEENSQGVYDDGSACSYDATFASLVVSAVDDLHLQSSGPGGFTSSTAKVAASYATMFEPDIVPAFPLLAAGSTDDIYDGVRMRVTFRSSPRVSGCSGRQELGFTVLSNGAVKASGDVLNIIDRPSESTVRCSYSVTVPSSFKDGKLATATASLDSVDAESDRLTVAYNRTFKPELTFEISQTGGSQTDFEGDVIDIDFVATDTSPESCADALMTYAIDAGNMFRVDGDQPVLVGSIPAHDSQGGQIENEVCEYGVSFVFPDGRLTYQGTETVTVGLAMPTKAVTLSVVSS